MSERSADRRFCGPRLFRSHHRHRTVFYRGVETPASFSLRSIFLYRRAPALAAREIHRAWFRPVGASLQASAGTAPFSPDSLGLSPRPPALHLRAGVSGNDFTGHEVGEAELDERGQPAPGCRRRTLAAQVLRPRPAHRQGIQRKGGIHSPQPGEGRFGQPPRRLARVKLQRIRWHERRRTKRTLRFDRRPGENALRSARTNLIAPSRGRKDADHKSGGPRYPLTRLHASDRRGRRD